ncbi:MAG: radical SAM protein [Deltaproteobacteria bacterium]|nr:radical SAM protein [Deltaproteobacteria bacterium]MBI2974856.1 radical SAM protein [Deltaproteobacteria bacterium]
MADNTPHMSWKIKSHLKQLVREEEGTVIKDFGGKRSIVLVYPNTYFVGMSNLGMHNIYRLLNEREDTACERAFLPEKNLIAEHKRTNTPVLSVESQKPISEFQKIAFSIAFENDFKNISAVLELSNIPVDKTERGGRYPEIIAGGAAVTLNPKLFEKICDKIVSGDFEASSAEKKPARSAVWTNNTEFGSMHLVEMQRGCPHRCGFCAAPIIYHPFKQFSKEEIMEAINFGLPHRKKIGLIGGDVLAHPDFEEIAEYIHSKGGSFSPSSVRADRMTPSIAALLRKSGHKTVTLAPESGSENLRKTIGKNIPDEKFFKAAEILSSNGIKQIKLYFMIGLPGETDKDIEAIGDFINEMNKADVGLKISVNPFVPKNKTQFQDERFEGVAELKRKISLLKKVLSKSRCRAVKFESPISALHEYKMQH